jgi:hypothetical protein
MLAKLGEKVTGWTRSAVLRYALFRWAFGLLMPAVVMGDVLKGKRSQFRTKDEWPENSGASFSQNFQDLVLLSAVESDEAGSHARVPRTFVELGGEHPFLGSNSALLQELGWGGYCRTAACLLVQYRK